MRFLEYVKNEGYIPYSGAVDGKVYDFFNCPCPEKACWYYKDGSFQCVGCKEQCETDDGCGFQLFLGIDGVRPKC